MYIIGPDDRLSLYFFGELDQEYPLTVNAEGTVNIPTVGSLAIGDLTLAEAKTAIAKEVKKKYSDIQLSITLANPRFFRVFVSGMVLSPGAKETHALQRVSDVIERAGLTMLERYQMMSPAISGATGTARVAGSTLERQLADIELESFLKRASSLRTIVIHRGDAQIPVDLQRFRRFGDLDSNPYVQAGDRIEVPPYVGNLFVYGETSEPGRYEFKPGDRVLDLIQFAGGVTASADSTRATITRFGEDGKEIEHIEISLFEALIHNPDDQRYRLQESDRLNVWRKYDYKTLANVRLTGEVRYPGLYPITPNETTLSQLIAMAGGLTDRANLDEARFIRPASTVQDLEYQRLSRMMVADMTSDEYDLFRNLSRSRRGEISVDFVKLFQQNDMSNDVRLHNNDMVTIPVTHDFVNVMGAVQQPGFMQVEPGQTLEYYVDKAGGYNWNAQKGRIRIIKARTGQRFRPQRGVAIEGGDTIHIPEKRPVDVWAFTKDSALLFANVATIVILARQLTN